jgi:hypothetical protein
MVVIHFTFTMPFGFSSEGDPQNPIPIKGHEDVTGYYVHDVYDFLFMAHTDGEVHSSLFLCDLCSKWYAFGGTFGNCKKHLERKHSGLLKQEAQKSANCKPSGESPASQEEVLMLLLEHDLPFSLVESALFRKITRTSYCRESMARLAHTCADRLRKALSQNLERQTRCVLTFDEWTDGSAVKYMGINALTTGGLGYRIFCLAHVPLDPDEGKAAALAEVVRKTLDNFGLIGKVVYAVTDTTPVMPKTTSLLRLKWMPCFAHLFNLMLGQLIEAVRAFIQPLLTAVGPIALSTKWTKLVKEQRVQRIPSYSPTRWYSMEKLVRNCLTLRPQIEEFIATASQSVRHERFNAITCETWDVFQMIHGVLVTFRNAVEMLESDEYGTVSHVLEAHMMVDTTITNLNAEPDCPEHIKEKIEIVASTWRTTQSKHWQNPLTLSVGSAPSPSPKKSLSPDAQQISGTVREILILAVFLNPSVPLESLKPQDRCVGEELLRERVKGVKKAMPESQSGRNGTRRSIGKRMTRQDLYGAPEEWDEVTEYLRVNRQNMCRQASFRLGEWWIGEKTNYPILFAISEDILLIPATSATSERPFSKAGRIKTKGRLSLKPDNMEAMMALATNTRLAGEVLFPHPPESGSQ